MSNDETRAFHNDDELDQIIASYLQELQTTQAPSEEELLAQHPQFATELREFFADREQFEQMAQPMRDVVNAPAIGSQVKYIGDYELLDELGRGGMGVVYKAQQVSLKRLVALKMILSGEHASEQDLSRFRAEVEAIAKLQHPHIVQIHEIGEHEGNPYAALEYVEGGSLADQLDGTPLSPTRTAALVETLARAVHVAHQQGIVHRDLKPANVLMTTDGQPKITDFGLAKLMKEESNKTRTGAILGTPSYMAPEQAEGKNTDIGPATDVYALGAILYECLTGRPPFRAESTLETIKLVVSEEPVSPTRLQPTLARDLETICLKCLQKEPFRRYTIAKELAEDLQRYQNQEPIQARPVSVTERAFKWIKRKPAQAGLVFSTALFLILLSVGGPLIAVQQAQLRNDAEEAQKVAEQNAQKEKQANQKAQLAQQLAKKQLTRAEWLLYGHQITLAQCKWNENQTASARKYLQETSKDLRGWEYEYLFNQFHQEQFNLQGHTNLVRAIDFSPDGNQLVSASDDRTVKLWDRKTGKLLHTLKGHSGGVADVAFSPDGTRIISASQFTRQSNKHLQGELLLRDAQTGMPLKTIKGAFGPIAFSPDGQQIISTIPTEQGKNVMLNQLQLWNVNTGQKLQTFEGHNNSINDVAVSPDGQWIASASWDKTVRIWNANTGKTLQVLQGHEEGVISVAFSPSGKHIASGGTGADKTVRVWNVKTGKSILVLRGHTFGISEVRYSPDGKYLASASKTIKLWNARTGKEIQTIRGHTDTVSALAFSPAGKQLASGSVDTTIKLWNALPKQNDCTFQGHTSTVTDVAISPDGKLLASASQDHAVRIWDIQTRQSLRTLKGHQRFVTCVAFSPNGKHVASGSYDQTVLIHEVNTGKTTLTLKGHKRGVNAVVFSLDGKYIVSASLNGTLRVWDSTTGKVVHVLAGHGGLVGEVVFHPDGKEVVSGSLDRTIRFWDVQTGKHLRTLNVREEIRSVAISPNGSTLLAGGGSIGESGILLMWNLKTNQKIASFKTHSDAPINSVVISPDGRRIASVGYDHHLRIWNVANQKELLSLKGAEQTVVFSPSGRQLFSGSGRKVKCWNKLNR